MNNKCTYCFNNKILFIPDTYNSNDLEYCPICNHQSDESFNKIIYLSDKDRDLFIENINNPPKPSEYLIDLMKKKD